MFCRWSIDLFCVDMVPEVSLTLGVDGSTIATEFCFKKYVLLFLSLCCFSYLIICLIVV